MSAKNETKEVKSSTDIKSGISASNVKTPSIWYS